MDEQAMTPEQFKEEMLKIRRIELGDIPEAHSEADKLLCKLLEQLGYGEGIQAYREMEKWYE